MKVERCYNRRVLFRKGYRYRIYPTPAQVERLTSWEHALRFLWNLANEQRVMGLARPRGERRYPTAFDQMKDLTALRRELPWLADVPRNVCAKLLVELDKSWQRCFKRLARRPRWKRKNLDVIGLTEPHPKVWRLDGNALRFPKLGPMSIVVHRPPTGKPKTCTVRRDGDQWFSSVICELQVVEPARRTEPVVALDRGVVNLVADSDGRIVKNPRNLEAALVRLGRAQRTAARRKRGSKNREKAKLRVMRVHRRVRRQRDHVLHVLSHAYTKSHGTVVVENLQINNMVRANRGLARSILDAGWGKLVSLLDYKLRWSGGQLLKVPAAYSSQTCAACGHVDRASRHGERFCCTSCGHVAHADVNAAKVLLRRANHSVLPVEGSVPETTLRNRKLRSKLRVPRRSASESSSL